VRNSRVLCVAAIFFATLVFAVEQGDSALRMVSGRVVDSQDQPLHKAVVHLKNTRTLAIKTYITEPDGTYRFSALSPNVDYELYADYEGEHSETKTVSAFSNRKQVVVNLKVRTSKQRIELRSQSNRQRKQKGHLFRRPFSLNSNYPITKLLNYQFCNQSWSFPARFQLMMSPSVVVALDAGCL